MYTPSLNLIICYLVLSCLLYTRFLSNLVVLSITPQLLVPDGVVISTFPIKSPPSHPLFHISSDKSVPLWPTSSPDMSPDVYSLLSL